ncbi:hypothetical protein P153DRAFT_432605 [Dothidotthia symphoricarpi CBS 119687]|uniref:Cyanovirin-N domain-containing protein n=1 Tax=Dothidotthia symphoricarpi CBS 119687 TaxID=1392245 RepID=A0A6A6A8R8_9PLEO|nr:uncharacterized protein P153DRAFT_432605 [Dothidotthia symphoricarpi CBS 119687]KAF2128249.1 hypothetical protein P153DRAFT_432605 [Dothidotthia symphoricarpi CBS 119687]
MQLIHATLFLWLNLLRFTVASGTCTSSGSLSWPPVGDCSITPKYDTTIQNCRACSMNDADAFQACLKASGLRKRDTTSEHFFGAILRKKELKSRVVALSCEVHEGCYKFTDGSLLCLNLGTGLYHDDVGGNGDYYSGEYTGPDGKVQTGTSTATATSGSKSSSTASQMTGSTATATARITSAGTASASASSAAASMISSAGSDVFYLGTYVGIVGLIAAGL